MANFSHLTQNECSSSPGRYNCSICSTSFRRREHHERHLNSHLRRKDFECEICDKRFARRDTLQRHSTIHGQLSTKTRRTLPRATRACVNCVKSKQRCSGSQPCDRCNRKDWPCQFTKGSSEVALQGRKILPDTTGQRTNYQTNDNSKPVDISEPSHASETFSVNAIHADPRGPRSVDFTGGPCADLAFPSQAGQTAPYCEATSIFDSFLLWPMDDAIEHSDIALTDPSSLQTPSGMAGTMNQPTKRMSGAETEMELTGFQQGLPTHAVEARPSFSAQSNIYIPETALTEDDRDILISEDYRHVPKPSVLVYERICALYAEVSQSSPEASLPRLYSLDILHVCTQLYFEHFHQVFPILHKATFEARPSSWLLYLAVSAVGSQYSRLSIRNRIFSDLVKAIRLSLLRTVSLNSALSFQNNLELAQATLLFNIALLFGGAREGIMHLQYQRNVLVTTCRPLLVPGVLFAKNSMLSAASVSIGDWTLWIAAESWKRVVYFTWLIECFQLVLFDLPPLITVGEMHLSMPCDDKLWQSSNFHDWELARDLQRGDPDESLSVTCLLKMEVVDQEYIRSLSDSALLMSVFAVYAAEKHNSQLQSLHLFSNMHSTRDWGLRAPGHEKDAVEAIIERLQQAVTQRVQDAPILSTVTKFSLVLRLLRFVQYRQLYISSGWMAQNQEVQAAAQHITQLLHAEPRQARQSLLHAAQLFRIIRCQRQFNPYDSFILLMAVLYIWNYDRFVISDKSQYFCDGGPEEIFRIDQNLNKDVQEKWVAGAFEIREQLHITGLGVLNGQDSVPRILRETIRILDHDKAWSRQANNIKRALQQILLGRTPTFSAEPE